jgi:hypothetical protein
MSVQKLSSSQNLLVGMFSGTCETFLQMPLITWKICQQNGNPFPKTIGGWYRGVMIQTASIAPITAFQVWTNSILTNTFINNSKITSSEKISIAALSGGLSSVIYSPVDLITIHQQKTKKSMIKTSNMIFKNNGLLSLWKGIFPCAIRESIYVSGFLGFSPIMCKYFNQETNLGENYSKIFGCLFTGITCSLITHPFDTTKTLIQSDLNTKRNLFPYMNELYQTNGLSYFYKGCIPRALRSAGAFGVFLVMEEQAIKLNQKYKF